MILYQETYVGCAGVRALLIALCFILVFAQGALSSFIKSV